MDAQLGAMTQGELTLAASLQVPNQSLTVFDRAYFSAAFLLDWQSQGCDRHWLMRAKDNLRCEVDATHGKGDCTIRMPVSPRARKLAPEVPLWWQARLIEVKLAGRMGNPVADRFTVDTFAEWVFRATVTGHSGGS